MNHVANYDNNELMTGRVSRTLSKASRAAMPTGGVPAYRDANGVWQYVEPSLVDHYRRNLGETVQTVYVVSVNA